MERKENIKNLLKSTKDTMIEELKIEKSNTSFLRACLAIIEAFSRIDLESEDIDTPGYGMARPISERLEGMVHRKNRDMVDSERTSQEILTNIQSLNAIGQCSLLTDTEKTKYKNSLTGLIDNGIKELDALAELAELAEKEEKGGKDGGLTNAESGASEASAGNPT